MLSVKNLGYSVGSKHILTNVSAQFEHNLFHAIVGPNGSGKSTFLKIFSGELQPQYGTVEYGGMNIFSIPKKELARHRAVMSQQPELYFPLTVDEIVLMGRYPHFGFRHSEKDAAICEEAMRQMDIADLRARDYLTLSGGEKQRVQFARVLAQIWEPENKKPRYLFLDEANAHLDLKHQQQLLDLAKRMSKNGVLVIAILHDLNLALHYADHMLFMKQGNIAYSLHKPAATLTNTIIREIFEVESSIVDISQNKKVIVFDQFNY